MAEADKRRELRNRLLTAAVAAPVLIYCFWQGTWSLLLLVTTFSILGVLEFCDLQEKKGVLAFRGTAVVAALALNLAVYFGGLAAAAVTFALIAILLVLSTVLGPYQETALQRIAGTLFPQAYISLLMSHFYLIRQKTMPFDLSPLDVEDGFVFLLLVVFLAMLNDTGSYFGGRFFGKHPLAPGISPKKTWEGALGGALTCLATALLVKLAFRIPGAVGPLVCLALIVHVMGLLGDLAESQLKRSAQVKDSGDFFPGHGGVLDRLDSLVFVAPAAYYFIEIWARYRLS
ncbi:MAG: phosphatidate cytidylyltransferase [Nitrospirae bacterium]|nr:phosphatidate cytidylyltransferase [Nitrospirota bacterium]